MATSAPCTYLFVRPALVAAQSSVAGKDSDAGTKPSTHKKTGGLPTETRPHKSKLSKGHTSAKVLPQGPPATVEAHSAPTSVATPAVLESFSNHLDHALRRHLIEEPDARRNPLHNVTLGALVRWCEEWKRGQPTDEDGISPSQRNAIVLKLFVSAVGATKGSPLNNKSPVSPGPSALVFQKTKCPPFSPVFIKADVPAFMLAYAAISRGTRHQAREAKLAVVPVVANSSAPAKKAPPAESPKPAVLSPRRPDATPNPASPFILKGSSPRRYMAQSHNVSLTGVNISLGDDKGVNQQINSVHTENGKSSGRAQLTRGASLSATNPYQLASSALHKRLKLDILNSDIYHKNSGSGLQTISMKCENAAGEAKWVAPSQQKKESAPIEVALSPAAEDHDQEVAPHVAAPTTTSSTHFAENPQTTIAELLTWLIPPSVYPPSLVGVSPSSSARPLDWHVTVTITLSG